VATDPTPTVVETPADVQTWIGAKTGIPSETWLTFLKVGMSIMLSTGIVKPADASTLYGAITNLVVAAIAVAASAWTIVNYTKSRTLHKTAALSNVPATAQVTVKT